MGIQFEVSNSINKIEVIQLGTIITIRIHWYQAHFC